MILPTITLWEPWASWIAWGWKRIESRTHERLAALAGQRILIHAGKTWHAEAFDLARPYLTAAQLDYTRFELQAKRGATTAGRIVAGCRVTAHRALTEDDSPLVLCPAEGMFGLELAKVHRPDRILTVRGDRGIWRCTVPDDMRWIPVADGPTTKNTTETTC
jgi:hypothetical protein